jgi:hypothetical protein
MPKSEKSYCPDCLRVVEPLTVDEGIGWYSYGSARECHESLVECCPLCGNPLDPTVTPCTYCDLESCEECTAPEYWD